MNEDVIRRKVVEKLETLTTLPLEETEEGEDDASGSLADSNDPDIVITTGSDADSSAGNKVVATSVDGEDDVVDVTMKDSVSTAPKQESLP